MKTEPNAAPVAAASGGNGGAPADVAAEPATGTAPFPKRILAWGTGCGIEIGERDLRVAVARVRPSGIAVLGAAEVKDFPTRPAAEWGAELGRFLAGIGAGHVAATVLLPRRDVIVRQLPLPGLGGKDLRNAIRLQLDTLHPFGDEEVDWSYARIGSTPMVLVGIVRREASERIGALFVEAGIKVASFTFSAGVLYSASRLLRQPRFPVIAFRTSPEGTELYGESEARPLFSASVPVASERALQLARGELRLPAEVEAVPFSQILPAPGVYPSHYDPGNEESFQEHSLVYASALAGACPHLGIEANLLPPERRRASSRVRLIPTIALAVILLGMLIALAFQNGYQDARYLGLLQSEIERYKPAARRLESIEKQITAIRARTQSIDDLRRRTRADMDALGEITRLVQPPGWVVNLDMDRKQVQLSGESESSAALLEAFDKSPLFENSEFTMPISRQASGEAFRIRTQRQAGGGAVLSTQSPNAGPTGTARLSPVAAPTSPVKSGALQ